MKKKILLFDDVVHDRTERQSKLEGFAERLRTQEGFLCEAVLPVDKRGFGLRDRTLDEMGQWLKDLVISHSADGIVIDLDWWGDPAFGEKIWQLAKSLGLLLDNQSVVFISEHATLAERLRICSENDLHTDQVVYRNARGAEVAAQWLREHI